LRGSALCYGRSPPSDSNREPTAYKAVALPIELGGPKDLPPWREREQTIPPILLSSTICLRAPWFPHRTLALCGLVGVTHRRPSRCDETEPYRHRLRFPSTTARLPHRISPVWSAMYGPGPLALLPGARSPSRRRHRRRWWALTPPFHPSPGSLGIPRAPAGLLSVAVVVNEGSRHRCPHLRFRGAPLPCQERRAGSREVPLRSLDDSPAADRLLPATPSPILY
jgi:hypothetical protein